MNYNYNRLPYFKWFVLQNFPFIEEDFDAITNYELYCKIVEYLNKVIERENNLGNQVESLTNSFNNLTNYVDNYFDNLDVQDEIDNKLDEMAESGELTEIISEYLNLNSIIAFNTVADMGACENAIDGSYFKIYGKLTYNDGEGAFYKVRTLINTDVIDGDLLVALTNFPTLVAEKIPDKNINDILSYISNINNSISSINNSINTLNSQMTNKQNILNKMVVFGDSWSDLNVTDAIWSSNIADTLNLTLHNYAVNGAGFVAPSNNLISSQVTTFENSNVDKTKVKFIVLAGGVNDYRNSVTVANLRNAIISVIDDLQNLCPQAKIIYVSNCQYPYSRSQSFFWVQLHNQLSTAKQIATYNMDGTFGKPLFNNNNYFHLTQAGQLVWGRNILATLTGGEIINYRNQETYEDSEIKLIYSTQRVKDMILLSVVIIPKENLTSKSISFSSPGLSYDDVDIFGGVGRSYRNIIVQISSTSIAIASNDTLFANNPYYLKNIIPITEFY